MCVADHGETGIEYAVEREDVDFHMGKPISTIGKNRIKVVNIDSMRESGARVKWHPSHRNGCAFHPLTTIRRLQMIKLALFARLEAKRGPFAKWIALRLTAPGRIRHT